MGAILSQCAFIPAPTLTEHNLSDQTGKVHIVTGGYSGVGLELVELLYSRHAKVFIAGRDVRKGKSAMLNVRAAHPESLGSLEFLWLDLSDLSSIKPSVADFEARADRLDVLVNNAGVMVPPIGSRTAQGHELQHGVNCLGAFLLTTLLMLMLQKTAGTAPVGSIRVVWAASIVVELAPAGGMTRTEKGEPLVSATSQAANYTNTKVGNVYLAMETARRYSQDGIASVAFNPGNLRTPLQRNMPWWQYAVAKTILFPSALGAYTELYAGWSEDIGCQGTASYVVPWGRLASLREDIANEAKPQSDGGGGRAEQFWRWCERCTREYA